MPSAVLLSITFQYQRKRMEIRRAVGRSVNSAVIESISRYGDRSPKYMVQFTKENMVESVLLNWLEDNFGSSKVRKPINRADVTHSVGFAKHVPTDLGDEQLATAITKAYPGSTGQRIKKGQQALKTEDKILLTKLTRCGHQQRSAIRNAFSECQGRKTCTDC